MNLIINVFRKSLDFTGRSRRKEFWTYAFFNGAIVFILTFYYYFFSNGTMAHLLEILNTVLGLGLLFPLIALTVRRLHDTGRSGWWALVIFVPVIGQLAFLVFMMQNSEIGYNEYGEYSKFQWSYQ